MDKFVNWVFGGDGKTQSKKGRFSFSNIILTNSSKQSAYYLKESFGHSLVCQIWVVGALAVKSASVILRKYTQLPKKRAALIIDFWEITKCKMYVY